MRTIACVACGPSLSAAQVAMIEAARAAGRCHVLVVNRAWEYLPRADVLYAADPRWWERYWPAVQAGFAGECWTCKAETAREFDLCHIRSTGRKGGISRDPTLIHENCNGGAQIVNLARHFLMQAPAGERRILLAGYDMQHTGGRAHCHDDYPDGWSNAAGVKAWAPLFNAIHADLRAEGISLINCTLETALTIPRGDLATELERGCVPA